MNTLLRIRKHILVLTAALGMSLLHSCTEEIDTSARHTFTGKTIISYLEDYPERYSEYTALLGAVNVSDFSQSTLSQLLSARGNYTCFAPTNDAIKKYLEQLKENGVITEATWDAPEFKVIDPETQKCLLLEETRKTITYNSLINHGELTPYIINDISERSLREEMLPLPNFMDRKLTCSGDNGQYFINGSRIDKEQCDIYTINGRIHQIDQVISPNTQTADEYFQEIISTKVGDFYAFACLVEACGLSETLSKEQDEEYYNKVMKGDLSDLDAHPTNHTKGFLPQRKYIGYTFFAEDDAWWENALGLEGSIKELSPSEIVERIAEYVVQNGYALGTAHSGTDYTNENNALNQFVTYHIVPGKLEVSKLVIHFNELRYNLKDKVKMASVFDYYCTMGKRRLIKTYEANTGPIYLNRFPVLKNGRGLDQNYTEVSCDENKKGIEIYTSDNPEIYNAFLYRISDCLYYNDDMATTMASERIRIDFSSMFPELMSNNIRANENFNVENTSVGIPVDSKYKYLENCDISDETRFFYLSGRLNETSCWANYQGDEFNIVGNYEVTFKLPPVPKTGMYELRLGVSVNNQRGMCQVYWGENKDNLPAADIPLDMRMGGIKWYIDKKDPSNTINSILGFQLDDENDELINVENDKILRNNKVMKAPNSYYVYGEDVTIRNHVDYVGDKGNVVRRIILTKSMSADKTYYLRLKSVLQDSETQLYLDYMEFCPKEVYDNPTNPEDIW